MQDREFVEQDLADAQLAQQANADNQQQSLSLSKKLKLAAKGTTSSTSSCISSTCCCASVGRLRRRLPSSAGSGSGAGQTGSQAGSTTGRHNTDDWELNDMESVQKGSPAQHTCTDQPLPSTSKHTGSNLVDP